MNDYSSFAIFGFWRIISKAKYKNKPNQKPPQKTPQKTIPGYLACFGPGFYCESLSQETGGWHACLRIIIVFAYIDSVRKQSLDMTNVGLFKTRPGGHSVGPQRVRHRVGLWEFCMFNFSVGGVQSDLTPPHPLPRRYQPASSQGGEDQGGVCWPHLEGLQLQTALIFSMGRRVEPVKSRVKCGIWGSDQHPCSGVAVCLQCSSCTFIMRRGCGQTRGGSKAAAPH